MLKSAILYAIGFDEYCLVPHGNPCYTEFEVITIITKELVDKINALARKQRTEGLTPEEKEEQHALRQQYLAGIRGQVVDTLSRIKYVEDEPSCGCGCSNHDHQHHAPKSKGGCNCGCGGNHSDNKGHTH